MNDFGFSRMVAFGGAIDLDTPVSRLHPVTRLAATSLIMAGLVAARSSVLLATVFFLLLVLYRLAGLPVRRGLKSLAVAAPLVLLVAVLQILAIPKHDTGRVLADLGFARVTTGDLVVTAAMMFRFAGLIMLIVLAVAVIPSRELTRGLEVGLAPLTRVGFPAHEFSLAVTVTLRFIPIVLQEAEDLAKAQASRGADFGKGRGGVIKRVRRMLPLLVPLFLTSLRRAENLVLAMEARCYTGGKGRTQLILHTAHPRDVLVGFGCLLTLFVLVAGNPLQIDRIVARFLVRWLEVMRTS